MQQQLELSQQQLASLQQRVEETAVLKVKWHLLSQNISLPPRCSGAMANHGSELILAGGWTHLNVGIANIIPLRDVWATSDGVNWIPRTLNAAWSARWDHRLLSFNGSLFLLGGTS